MKLILLEETSSTNEYIKRFLPAGEDVAVCALRQTGGKGTKGRSFSSEEGGVYLSFLRFYEHFPAERAFEIMTHAAVAVCRAAERFGIACEIKWCNDVLAGGRKLSGILIENILSGGFVRASIVGIGLNVRNRLTGLEKIAVSMGELLPSPPAVSDVRDALIESYEQNSGFSDYLSYVKFLGGSVLVTQGEERFSATAVGILPDGRLLIERNGTRTALSAAEIAIKF